MPKCSGQIRPSNTIRSPGTQAAGPTTGRHLRAAQKVATIQLKFGVHPGKVRQGHPNPNLLPSVTMQGIVVE
jgi:hypothetical protein